jgi:hypothetical protein
MPLPQGPLAPRQLHTAVWTGDRVLIWGGRSGLDLYPPDSAAYDPASAGWARSRRGPLPPRAGHTAVWTGDRMLVWGGCCTSQEEGLADGAAFTVVAPSPAPTPSPAATTAPIVAPSPAQEREGIPVVPIVVAAAVGLGGVVALMAAARRRRG